MSSWWLDGLLVICFFVCVNSREDIDIALTLAHCRASCIHEIHMAHVTQQTCRNSRECSQCWDTCRSFQSSSSYRRVCTTDQCIGGCLKACHWLSAGYPPPVLLTKPSEELTFTLHTASWPPPASATPTPVYVVMVDHQQYLQTLDLTASLPHAVDPLTVQVLVVDWRGLTEVFTPRPQSPLEQARILVHRLGLEKTIDMKERLNNSSGKQVIFKSPWKLREVSRTYLTDLVKIEISWEPQQLASTAHLIYLVTWQVEGGVLRGNLLTNTSSTILSLQSNTTFRIQVSLFTLNSTDWESELLEVDTHHNTMEKSHLRSRSHPVLLPAVKHPQLAIVLVAGAVTLLVVVLVFTWTWRHRMSHPHCKLTEEDLGVPKMYRVFPPAVRLIGDSLDVNPDIFSSRDNLLQN